MKNPFKTLRTNRLSTKIILMTEVVLILSSCIFCTVSIINGRAAIRSSIQQRMLDIANCAAGSVDGDILEALTAEDADTAEYRAVYDALAIYRDNVELDYVYGIRDEGGGRFTLTVDPALNDPGEFGEEITATKALTLASTGTAAVDQVPYTDAWGDFYSAYSPVFDSSGRVAGIIAADFSVTWFESQLSAQTRSTVISCVVILLATLLAAALLSLIVVPPFVRRQEQLSLEVKRKADENEQLILQIVRSLADAVDAKDAYSNGHSRRVSGYSEKLAEAMGWEKERIDGLRYAALLHDIGKIGVPDSILHSPRSLTKVEYDIVKTHTTLGGDILKNKIMNKTAENVARCHHEQYDGTGYPLGLSGKDIPEEARIVAIADAFDAMGSSRAYRKARDAAYIRRELIEGKGKQFDPDLTDRFIGLWDQRLLDHIGEKDPEENGSIDRTSALLQEVVEAVVAQSAADDIDIVTGVLNRTAGEGLIARAMREGGKPFRSRLFPDFCPSDLISSINNKNTIVIAAVLHCAVQCNRFFQTSV